MQEDRGFKPSKRRLRKARSEGKVLKSQLLSQTFGTIACALSALLLVRCTWVSTRILLEYTIVEGFEDPLSCLIAAFRVFLMVSGGSLILGIASVILLETIQVGYRVELSPLSPSLNRLEPASGMKRILSGVGQSWQTLLKTAGVLIAVIYFVLRVFSELPPLFYLPDRAKTAFFYRTYLEFLSGSFVVLLVFGVLEYLLRRREFYRQLSMSREDLKQEQKDSEGDPSFRLFRRAAYESILTQDVISRVRKAKVIIVERSTA